MNGKPLENPFLPALGAAGVAILVVLAATSAFFVSPLIAPAVFLAAGLIWVIFRYPMGVLGALLAFMPVDYMVIEVGKVLGLPYMTVVSACTKEIPLLLLLIILGRRNGLKLMATDWFLLALIAVAALRTVFDGNLVSLVTDFQFALPYFVGRVTLLTPEQESRWAKRAVWIIAILAVLGMSEVFIFGGGPRTALYLATDSVTENGTLTASFGGAGFVGLREASTMVGPAFFAAMCMIALILWWVYLRNPVPAAMAAAGLICAITRSAWIGTALAVTLLAAVLGQWKRWALCVTLALAVFLAAIPILGIHDYLFYTRTGQDDSAQGHQQSALLGFQLIGSEPFGMGNRMVGIAAVWQNGNAGLVETTYLAFGAEYGIAAGLCFLGFFISALWRAWRQQSQLGYATVGIMVGLGFMMTVLLMHLDRRFACWSWFPVGLAVRAMPESRTQS